MIFDFNERGINVQRARTLGAYETWGEIRPAIAGNSQQQQI